MVLWKPFATIPAEMSLLSGRVARNMNRIVKDAATEGGKVAVERTRVDTGKARSNWVAQLNSPFLGTIPPYFPGRKLGIDESANAIAAQNQHKQVIASFDVRKSQSIHITNNVEYIGILNDGGPRVAPGLMIEQAIQAVMERTRRHKLLDK